MLFWDVVVTLEERISQIIPKTQFSRTVQHQPKLFGTATGNNGELDLCVLVR